MADDIGVYSVAPYWHADRTNKNGSLNLRGVERKWTSLCGGTKSLFARTCDCLRTVRSHIFSHRVRRWPFLFQSFRICERVDFYAVYGTWPWETLRLKTVLKTAERKTAEKQDVEKRRKITMKTAKTSLRLPSEHYIETRQNISFKLAKILQWKLIKTLGCKPPNSKRHVGLTVIPFSKISSH